MLIEGYEHVVGRLIDTVEIYNERLAASFRVISMSLQSPRYRSVANRRARSRPALRSNAVAPFLVPYLEDD